MYKVNAALHSTAASNALSTNRLGHANGMKTRVLAARNKALKAVRSIQVAWIGLPVWPKAVRAIMPNVTMPISPTVRACVAGPEGMAPVVEKAFKAKKIKSQK